MIDEKKQIKKKALQNPKKPSRLNIIRKKKRGNWVVKKKLEEKSLYML